MEALPIIFEIERAENPTDIAETAQGNDWQNTDTRDTSEITLAQKFLVNVNNLVLVYNYSNWMMRSYLRKTIMGQPTMEKLSNNRTNTYVKIV